MHETLSLRPRLALLIDAENVGPQHLSPIMERVADRGLVTVRRIFADWSEPSRSCWREPILQHALVAIQQFRLTPAKNGTDCALIIEAMDLAHSGRVDGVCLVTGDSDFTRLACRLRESGLAVWGFGQRNASSAFVLACDQFTHVEDLLPAGCEGPPPAVPLHLPPIAAIAAAIASPDPAPLAPKPKAAETAPPATKPKAAGKAVKLSSTHMQLIRSAYQNTAGEDGWASLSQFSSELHRLSPGFQVKQYGTSRLSRFLASVPGCEIRMVAGPHGKAPAPHSIRVE